MAKTKTITMRVTEDWHQACKIGAEELSQQLNIPVSTTTFIEWCVVETLTANGKDELATLAKGKRS